MVWTSEIALPFPCAVCVRLVLPESSEARIRGIDLDKPENVLFDRQTGTQVGSINFVQGVNFDVRNVGLQVQKIKGEKIGIAEVFTQDLSLKPYTWNKSNTDFVRFAQEFVSSLNSIENGVYESDCKRFSIILSEIITNLEQGYPMQTPARVNRVTGEFYVSRRYFKKCTLPMQMFILLHEYAHHDFEYSQPTIADNEMAVDLEAAKMYAGLGLPKIEAIYALTKLFTRKLDENIATDLIFGNYTGKAKNEQEARVIQLRDFFSNN